MNKDEILNTIEDFSAEQLFEFISSGKVTLEELRSTGDLSASKRNAIIKLLEAKTKEEKDFWNQHQYTEEGCERYLNSFPNGQYVEIAKNKIREFNREKEEKYKAKRKILDSLAKNPNSLTPSSIKKYLENNGENDNVKITREELIELSIPSDVIEGLYTIVDQDLQLGITPESIPDGYTEVYFWGIPGSGKTCVLSALLSTADKKGYLEMAMGPGLEYMTKLKKLFINPVSYVPPPSPVDSTQYLPFVLRKEKEDPRSVSLIELSGEIFECFYFKNINKPFPSKSHEDTLNSLLKFLNGNNRKIHFFFIDFEKENRVDSKGLSQEDYLTSASMYFQNNDIFKKSTDAIYLVITKSDLMDCDKSERKEYIKEYLQKSNFNSFVNSIRNRCKEHSINSGKILGTHFSLGNVYFKQICKFDPETSENLLDILIRRIKPEKKSILDVFNR